ncbi:MAG: NAD-dependent epimerase/dehydratase family protein [Cephaloticoccus sp.]|nr:NAD-dependent epimerase/dehydratase family protein [Cephaloticoccus sp.]MCF7759018.1 NAD-dependent epimerase/dehydratase family protein [Cephaloticoccus sp.]
MKVLIIGGSGLISTGIVKALKMRGADITVFNRGQTDDRLGDVHHLTGDRNDFPAFESSVAAAGPWDAVIDMICFRPDQAASDVRAFAGRCGHFLFCSTVCTYGNSQTIVPTDESTPQNPHSDYGRDKVACEEVFRQAHTAGKFPVTILRPSHTYGPGGVIINNIGWEPSFVDRLRRGLPIIVSGDGHGLWQSAFSEDVGVGFAHAAGNPKCFGEAYNITADEVVTWDEYTLRTAAAIGAPVPRIVHIPTDLLLAIDRERYLALAEIFRYHGVYSSDKLRRDVPEYRNATPFEAGVRQTVAWMDAHKTITSADPASKEDRLVAAWDKFTRDTVTGLGPISPGTG